jgi:hypothetical protein
MTNSCDVLTLVNRSVCGCYDPWIDPAEGIGFYTALFDRGFFISTVLDQYGVAHKFISSAGTSDPHLW